MKLGEVCLLTNDVCRLADFYRQLMDIEERSDDPVHQFIVKEEPMLTLYNDGQPHSTENSSVALAFSVDDIHAAHQKLISMRAQIIQPPTEQPWGAINLIFRDPDGNTVYLRQLA